MLPTYATAARRSILAFSLKGFWRVSIAWEEIAKLLRKYKFDATHVTQHEYNHVQKWARTDLKHMQFTLLTLSIKRETSIKFGESPSFGCSQSTGCCHDAIETFI